ncbi:hypothetical protein B296_00035855 [Ensete ventricosum]|uniref:Uncharacterized protein n=1 Tax=Ensete ventricosum TaxID=4639 RepID=A0A426XWZ0_ENSVE|nr:hypothetical protein B296_00035855 [Ensete ventricosum]
MELWFFGLKAQRGPAPGGGRGGEGVRRANRHTVASSSSKSRNQVSVRDRARECRRERRGWLTEAERRREAGSLRIWGGRGETTAGGGSDRSDTGFMSPNERGPQRVWAALGRNLDRIAGEDHFGPTYQGPYYDPNLSNYHH